MYSPKYVSILGSRRAELRGRLDQILSGCTSFLLEVGCGHGHFLTAYAAAHPERTCIGIDLIGERIERAEKKRTRARLENLHFIQAEARLFLEVLPAEPRIDAVFVLFPDPWPKARHNKHRIMQHSFLENLAAHVVPNCPLYFRTDFTPYYAAVREVLASEPRWQVSEEAWPFEYVTVFQQRAGSFQSLVARCTSPVAAANVASPQG